LWSVSSVKDGHDSVKDGKDVGSAVARAQAANEWCMSRHLCQPVIDGCLEGNIELGQAFNNLRRSMDAIGY